MNSEKPVSTFDRLRYQKLKKVIADHLEAGFKVWSAVKEIKESKFYLIEYQSWEDFCRGSLKLTPQHTNKMLIASEAIIDPVESQVVDGPSKSEYNVHFVSKQVSKQPDQKKSNKVIEIAAKSSNVPKIVDAVEVIKDDLGHPIPVKVQQYWRRKDELKELVNAISGVIKAIKEANEIQDLLFAEMEITGNIADLEKVRANIKFSIPYAVCSVCQGHPEAQKGGCRLCKNRGLLGKFLWDRCVPVEIKALRAKK